MKIHFKKKIVKLFLLWLVVFSFTTAPALAETSEDDKQIKERSFTALAIHQFNSDFDNGGDVSINRYFFQFDLNKMISVHYSLHDYSLSESASLWNLKRLEQVHNLGLGIKLMYPIDEEWRLFLFPSIEFSGESGATFNDSLIYGGVLGTAYRISPDFWIGAGVGVFSRLEEISVFPIIVVNWQINEKLKLSNPLRPGPSGPAGLELSYAINKRWELGVGGAYRSFRFRLKEEGTASNGIFEEHAIPVWGRVSWKLGNQINIDFNSGAFCAGKMKLENQDGNGISEDSYSTAPFVALTFSVYF